MVASPGLGLFAQLLQEIGEATQDIQHLSNTKYVKIKATLRVKSVQTYKSCFDILFKMIKVSNNTKMISELAPLGSPSPTAFRGLPHHLKMSVAFATATLKICKPFLYLASNESSKIQCPHLPKLVGTYLQLPLLLLHHASPTTEPRHSNC